MEEVVTAYETYPEVIKKYNELVEADSDGGGNDTGTTGVPSGTDGVGDAPTTNQSNLTEESTGVSVGEGDGA